MATEGTRTRTVLGHAGATSILGPAPRPPERAQQVWRRTLELADPRAAHDRFALALELLRAAHHDPTTMAHALSLGRTHLQAHPNDVVARRGMNVLEAAVAFLGVKPRSSEVGGPPGR